MTVPDDLSEMPPVVMNPSAIGNPHETPIVFAPGLAALACKRAAPSRVSNGGRCGGLNGHHAPDCGLPCRDCKHEEQRP